MMKYIAVSTLMIVLATAQWNPLRRIPQSPSAQQIQPVPFNNGQVASSSSLAAGNILQQHGRGPLALLLMQHYLSRNVTLQQVVYLGRPALKVSRNNEAYRASYETGSVSHYHTHVQLPLTTFYEGTIIVDVALVKNDRRSIAPSAGLAFRMQSNDQYDLVYFRSATAGSLLNAIQQDRRRRSSVQYISSPGWTPERLQLEQPWHYEAAARIIDGRWNRLRVDVRNHTLSVFTGSNPIPLINAPLLGSQFRGAVAYWVGDGTDAYFSGLAIREG